MEKKFTKGNWCIDGDFITLGYNFNDVIICDINPHTEEYITVHSYSKSESIANAKLIAAAPDLLEALESFVYDVENTQGNDNIFEEAYHLAKNAIKKATV